MKVFIGYAQIIIPVLLALAALRYVVLLARRASLILKLRHSSGSIEWKRRFASVFVRDGKADFILHNENGDTAVSIFTTPHRRGHYVFNSDGTVDIVKTRRQMFAVNAGRVPNGTASLDTTYVAKHYHIPAINTDNNVDYTRRVLLLHPAPAEVSAVINNRTESIGCGSEVCGYTIMSASSLTESLEASLS